LVVTRPLAASFAPKQKGMGQKAHAPFYVPNRLVCLLAKQLSKQAG
jgi:hypothetical protein